MCTSAIGRDVFALGGWASGASLIVRAIQEGQDAARGIHAYLQTVGGS